MQRVGSRVGVLGSEPRPVAPRGEAAIDDDADQPMADRAARAAAPSRVSRHVTRQTSRGLHGLRGCRARAAQARRRPGPRVAVRPARVRGTGSDLLISLYMTATGPPRAASDLRAQQSQRTSTSTAKPDIQHIATTSPPGGIPTRQKLYATSSVCKSSASTPGDHFRRARRTATPCIHELHARTNTGTQILRSIVLATNRTAARRHRPRDRCSPCKLVPPLRRAFGLAWHQPNCRWTRRASRSRSAHCWARGSATRAGPLP